MDSLTVCELIDCIPSPETAGKVRDALALAEKQLGVAAVLVSKGVNRPLETHIRKIWMMLP